MPAEPLTLLTERLLLRPFSVDDHDAVLAWEARDDVHRFLYTEPRSPEEVSEALARRSKMTLSTRRARHFGWPRSPVRRATSSAT